MTVEDIIIDYWAHRFWDDPQLREEIVDPDFSAEIAAAEAARDRPDDWETVTEDHY